MDILYLAILAIVQGVTEFLPVSSSGHLVLVPLFVGVTDHTLMFDVAVHVGTLGAVVLYLWRDIFSMFVGLFRLIKGQSDPGVQLLGLLITRNSILNRLCYFFAFLCSLLKGF